MKIELKEFQEEAARQLLRHVINARGEARDGDAQAIVLSSPTGSGKTVTITALMERIFKGHESWVGDRAAGIATIPGAFPGRALGWDAVHDGE